MNKRSLNIRMKDNYSNILSKMSDADKAWAEKFETMEYAIERGHNEVAKTIAAELKGSKLTAKQASTIDEERAVKERCNPVKAESENKRAGLRRTSDRKSPDNMYDPSDFIDQRFNAAGYEQAVSLSPEDAIIEAIDAARAANTTVSDLLFGNTTFTKPRGKGRPRKAGV